jgi:hypothetical protein
MMNTEGALGLSWIGAISRGAIRDIGPRARDPAGVSQRRRDEGEVATIRAMLAVGFIPDRDR